MPSASAVRECAPLVRRIEASEDTWWLEFDAPSIAAGALGGQFIMLGFGIEGPGCFMLPRPFSVGWCGDGRVGILLRVYGAGTRRLAELEVGENALLLGPLGRPFEIPEGREVLCVAGGVGLAPFILVAARRSAAGRPTRTLYGERTGDAVFDPGLLAELTGSRPEVYTEDGTLGAHGRVTAGLDPAGTELLLACGPTPMLRAVRSFAEQHGRDLQVSVEEHMGCGVGTCQGCVVPGADGRWIKSCLEGPVFDARDLKWP